MFTAAPLPTTAAFAELEPVEGDPLVIVPAPATICPVPGAPPEIFTVPVFAVSILYRARKYPPGPPAPACATSLVPEKILPSVPSPPATDIPLVVVKFHAPAHSMMSPPPPLPPVPQTAVPDQDPSCARPPPLPAPAYA